MRPWRLEHPSRPARPRPARRAAALLAVSLFLITAAAAAAAPAENAALARCDSLYAVEEFAAAAGCAQALLAEIEARGEDASPTAARLLLLAVRAHIHRGGRLDPVAAEYADRLLALTRSLHGPQSVETAIVIILTRNLSANSWAV